MTLSGNEDTSVQRLANFLLQDYSLTQTNLRGRRSAGLKACVDEICVIRRRQA